MRFLHVAITLPLFLFFLGCGGGGGGGSSLGSTTPTNPDTPTPSPDTPQSLGDKYGSLVTPATSVTIGGGITGATVSMSLFSSSSSSRYVPTSESRSLQYAFVEYRDVVVSDSQNRWKLASVLPAYDPTFRSSGLVNRVDSYGLPDDDNLILITITGGTFNDSGESLVGEISTLIPESYLEAGERPLFSSLGTYAAMQVQRANPSTKDEALLLLETYAKNFFDSDPSDGGVANFNSFNKFNQEDTSSIKDIDMYNSVIVANFENAIIDGDTVAINEVFEQDRDGDGVIASIGECSDENINTYGYKGRDCFDNRAELYEYVSSDKDGDFIPDDVEVYLGMDSSNWDENGNSIADGIDSAYDTYYKNQWHLRSTGLETNNINGVSTIVGNDLDILHIQRSYMGYNDGNFTAIQVVDSGVEANHEDIKDNMDYSLSINAVDGSSNPTPTDSVDNSNPESPLNIGHGNACTGVIAARGLNSKGVRGVTPLSKISGSNWMENQTTDGLADIWLVDDSSSSAKILVSNNSWGLNSGNSGKGEIVSYDTVLDEGATLRDGKGRVYLFASGNERVEGRDANLDAPATHHYSVPVAGLNYDNTHSPYSTPGSNVWLSGYSGSWYADTPTIATTLLMGKSYYESELNGEYGAITFDSDSVRGYTYGFNGTSVAAPTVSGVVALVLEACPNLTQRDIKYLSALTADKIDTKNSSWKTNSAGIKFSRDYGFGLIDGREMIEKCKGDYELLGAEKNTTITSSVTQSISGGSSYDIEFSVDSGIKIEYVNVWSSIDMRDYSALEMSLTSPSGTTIDIITGLKDDGDMDFSGGMRFGAAGFLDENSSGVWSLSIGSSNPTVGLSFSENKLQIYGR